MPDHLSVRDHAKGILTSTRTLNRVQSESEHTLTHEERPRPLDTIARPCLAGFVSQGGYAAVTHWDVDLEAVQVELG